MRKFLMVAAVGALVLLMGAPVMAVDFKFGAEYRVRFYDYTNFGFNDVQGTNPRGIQTRVRPRFDVSDDNGNIQATIRFEYGDQEWGAGGGANGTEMGATATGGSTGTKYIVPPSSARVGNGAGGAAGTDGVALETKWAYIDFALPFGIPMRVRVGQQPWYLPNSMIVDDDFSGVKAYGTITPVSYELWFFRAARSGNTTAVPSGAAGALGSSTTKDDSLDYYGGKIDLAIAKVLNPYVYGFYGDNRANCTGNTTGTYTDATACGYLGGPADRVRGQYYIGLGFTGDAGFMSYDFDAIYGNAKGGPVGNMYSLADGQPLDMHGYALQGGIHIPIGPVRWNIVGSYATGDKQNTSGHKSDAFPGGPGPSWSGPSQVAGGAYEIIGEGGRFDVKSLDTAMTNLWSIGTSLEYNPVKALLLRVHYLFAGFANKNGNCSTAVAGSIGCFGPAYYGNGFTLTKTINNTAQSATSLPQGTGGMAGKSSLGQEIGLYAEYLVWTGFKIQGFAGWLVPSGSGNDTTGKYILQFYYNF